MGVGLVAFPLLLFSSAYALGNQCTDLQCTRQLSSPDLLRIAASRMTGGDELLSDVPEGLLGQPRVFEPPPPAGVHPRVLLTSSELSALAARFKNGVNVAGTFEKFFYDFTKTEFGPGNEALELLQAIDVTQMNDTEKAAIAELGWGHKSNGRVARMEEATASAMILSSFHAFVQEEISGVESPIVNKLVKIMGTWADCIQSHARVYDCYEENVQCQGRPEGGFQGSLLWRKDWALAQEWGTGSFGLAMAFDLLWNKMGSGERLVVREKVRAALARIVKGRYSWGMGFDDRRIVSNWATYHGNLWLTNLAIEGEGADALIETDYPRVLNEFMKRAIYPDGSALEDGYVLSIALREGSNVLVAAEKRGHGHLTSQKFKNFVYHTAHMYEPWACGQYVGGSSGGGELYNSFHALVRSTYPEGPLSRMLWRQRMGDDFKGDGKCRALYTQTVTQLFHLGMSHETGTESSPDAMLPSYHYAPIRGLVIGRSNSTANGLYTHFDARGDCFLLGHDNADRGTFTISAFGQSLVPELDTWRDWPRSEHHSLLHIDGRAQVEKAACPTMREVFHDTSSPEGMTFASADLSKSYSVQWHKAFVNPDVVMENPEYYEGEPRNWIRDDASPYEYGWFESGYDGVIGLPAKLFGDPDFGFLGTYMYKKAVEGREQASVVRSTVHVREGAGSGGYFLVVDKASVNDGTEHEYSFQIVLADSLVEDSDLSRPGVITLTDQNGVYLDVLIHSEGGNFSYKIEPVAGGKNDEESANVLYIQSTAIDCEFWIVFHPFASASNLLNLSFEPGPGPGDPGILTVADNEDSSPQRFTLDAKHSVIAAATPLLTPMEPLELPVGSTLVKSREVESVDPLTFLLRQDDIFKFQVVFKLVESSVQGYRRTNVNTCNKYTRGNTRITILSCSDYMKRECTPVDGGFNDDACHGDNSRVKLKLGVRLTYFVVVEIAPDEDRRPRLKVKHRLNRGN